MGKKNNNDSGASGNKSTPSATSGEAEVVEVIPDEFKKVICDFINDFALTFPECSEKLDKYSSVDGSVAGAGRRILSDDNIIELYQHCKKVYPVRFLIFYIKMLKCLQNVMLVRKQV